MKPLKLHQTSGLSTCNGGPRNRIWQGIPGLERTACGRVFVSWFSGGSREPAAENTVYLCFSDNGGESFADLLTMAEPKNGVRCFDPCLWIDPKGMLWYFFNRGARDSVEHGVYARTCADPDAAKPEWETEIHIDFDTPFCFRMNKPTVLSTGEWVLPVTYASEPVCGWGGFDEKQLHGVGISKDDGKTWTLRGAIKTPNAALESMVVELRDGRLWMLIRTGGGVLWESHSADGGQSWGEANPTNIANPHSRFFIRRLSSQNLLLVNHYKFTGRSHLTAQLSTDDGETWNSGLLLDERGGDSDVQGVSYPDGVEDHCGLIWIVYDRDRQGAGEILLANFREEDVVAGNNVSGAMRLKRIINRLGDN